MGRYFEQQFRELQKYYPEIGDIRAVGLAIGIELVEDPVTKTPIKADITQKILDTAVSKGLLFQFARESVIKIKPALTINKSETDQVMDILAASFKEVLRSPKTYRIV